MNSAPHASPVALRYGRALFEVARDGGSLDQVQADMRLLAAVFEDEGAVVVLADPRIDQARKAGLLKKAFGELLHAHTASLLAVLERRNRLGLLPQVPIAFGALLDEHEGRLRGLLETARPVEDAARERLEKALSTSTGKSVHLTTEVREELLGGVRVTLAGTRFDGSARGRLERLRHRLASVELG